MSACTLKIVDDYDIFLGENRQLYFKSGDKTTEVKIKQCFPWSEPGNFLSLRDKDENEVFLINSIADLDESSRRTIESYLKVAEFVMEISRFEAIVEDVELRQYIVETNAGRRIFHTKLEDWPEHLPDGSWLIEDLGGDIFKVSDFEMLDANSQKLFSTYVM